MGYLDPKTRRLMVNAVRNGHNIEEVGEIFDVSRKTVWRWCKRTMKVGRPLYKDLPKRPQQSIRKLQKL